MATLIIMPMLGQSVESCIIAEILKKKDDAVKKGDVLFSYETDKACFEEVSPVDGVVLECFHNEGDEVLVLGKMMIVGQPGEDYSDLMATHSSETTEHLPTEVPEQATVVSSEPAFPEFEQKTRPSEETSIGISPRAKFLAAKELLDASQIKGSGPQGRVMERDIEVALVDRPKMTTLAKKLLVEEDFQLQSVGTGLAGRVKAVDLLPPANAIYAVDYEDKRISNMRKIIAKAMHASLQTSAQLTHHLGADARRIIELRKQVKLAMNEGKSVANITLNDMVCFAVIKALKKYPNVNTHFLDENIRYFNKVHLALAVDTDRGLMVPVLRNADDLSIVGLSNQFKELALACRKGAVNPEILSAEAGTFTVSNLGNYGVEMFTPVINLPQTAILGVNAIVPRPKDLGNGVYAFVPYVGLSLTYDHRSLDGAEATMFLKQIAIEIENLEIEY